MLATKEALRARAVADATLIGAALLNGTHVYQSAAEVPIEGLDAWITFGQVSNLTDKETGYHVEEYQFDVWARDPDRADRVAERLRAVFAWQPGVAGSGTLPALVGRRLAQPVAEIEGTPGDLAEQPETGSLHHRVRQFRVATYAA